MMQLPLELENYIPSRNSAEYQALARLNRDTHPKMVNGRMCSGHLQGSLLTFLSKLISPYSILEIGTYTGYSAICLAKGLQPGGQLHTIEINDELELFAQKYFREAGLENTIIQHIGDSSEIIQTLNKTFDLVFIDADKRKYLDDYQLLFPKVRIGGIIIADNTLWSGKVTEEPAVNDTQTQGILAFNDFVKNDNRVETTILPLRDGMTMLRKISE